MGMKQTYSTNGCTLMLGNESVAVFHDDAQLENIVAMLNAATSKSKKLTCPICKSELTPYNFSDIEGRWCAYQCECEEFPDAITRRGHR